MLHLIMLATILALAYCAAGTYGCMAFIHELMKLTEIPAVKKYLIGSRYKTGYDHAMAEFTKCGVLWLPLAIVAIISVTVMWWLLAYEMAVSGVSLTYTAFVSAATLTRFWQVTGRPSDVFKSWATQVGKARDAANLDILENRVNEIEAIVDAGGLTDVERNALEYELRVIMQHVAQLKQRTALPFNQ
jgi:hypothetical protein